MNFRIRSFEEYKSSYRQSVDHPDAFWDEIAKHYHWQKPWDATLDWEFESPKIRWFARAKCNISENCLDRHLPHARNKTALIWEPNDPADPALKYTFGELHEQVCRMANAFKNKGLTKGDRVAIYMPMIPELTMALLACARIGAVHNVVFAGFSAKALADRIKDSACTMVITADGLLRGTKTTNLKKTVDEALTVCPSVKSVLVARRLQNPVDMQKGRDYWLHSEMEEAQATCPPEPLDAEDVLFILYTSGSTGKPKGVVHTCGGYMVYAGYSFANVFQPGSDDVYWCTADIGWITGHSYIVYGPLLNGTTTVMFEGVPTYPDAGRFWKICEKHEVNQFYTAPTAIRSLMVHGEEMVKQYDLSKLKVLGSVGEPINHEAWEWYYHTVGSGKCTVVDTWWQTETGGIMISGLNGFGPSRATYAGLPLPGIQPVLLDKEGHEINASNEEGLLAVKFPWPGMLRTIYGDHKRCRETYFSLYPGYYFTGDGARRDEKGLFRIIGRVDDVINVSGHRFGTAEIENAINSNDSLVAESAVVGYPHDLKGQGIYAFVITKREPDNPARLRMEIEQSVTSQIGKIARPDKIQFVSGLPKTRSGKIMRRILRKLVEGEGDNIGDVSTLLDPSVVTDIQAGVL